MRTLLAMALLVALAACGVDREPVASSVPPVSAVPDPVASTANADAPIPPAQAGLAGFSGYGDVKLGLAAAEVEQAWGGALERDPGQDESCYYLQPTRAAASENDPAFMLADGTFVRYDIDGDREVAPGGGRNGMAKAEILRLYAGRVEQRPHKYSDGQYLRIADPAGGPGVLLFETGDDGKVMRWRVGLAPQVDYVEGCS